MANLYDSMAVTVFEWKFILMAKAKMTPVCAETGEITQYKTNIVHAYPLTQFKLWT